MKHIKATSSEAPKRALLFAGGCRKCIGLKSLFMSEPEAIARCDAKKDCTSHLSDRRLKRGIVGLRGALGKLLRLRGVTFEYNEAGRERGGPVGKRTGMIAQEVEAVFPEWVRMREDGYRELAIHGFEALAVEALRELKAEDDALREELAELRALVCGRDEAECAAVMT